MTDSNRPSELDLLIGEQRAALHRYCSRMVGSAFDGEDVVQDALAKAAQAWPGAGGVEHPERWLFRIAHNTALDALRHRRRRAVLTARAETSSESSEAADARVAAASSFATLMALSPAQRSCVVLVDVLGHSLEETAEVLGATLASAKAALHRGRIRLQALAQIDAPAAKLTPAMSQRLRDYADRFNARDFDALRALLADDVRLDLVNRVRLAGRKDVGIYFTRYDQAAFAWRVAAGQADGRPAIIVSDPSGPVLSVVLLDWQDGRISAIRDFMYAGYVIDGMAIQTI